MLAKHCQHPFCDLALLLEMLWIEANLLSDHNISKGNVKIGANPNKSLWSKI